MPNYFVSYEVTGQRPSSAEMENHLGKLGPSALGVLDRLWFVNYDGDVNAVYQHVNALLSEKDRVLVIEAKTCEWHNLRVPADYLKNSWGA